jgi:hypothetical protein
MLMVLLYCHIGAALLTTEGHGDCNNYSGIIICNNGLDFMRQGCENFSKNQLTLEL